MCLFYFSKLNGGKILECRQPEAIQPRVHTRPVYFVTTHFGPMCLASLSELKNFSKENEQNSNKVVCFQAHSSALHSTSNAKRPVT